MASIAPIPNPVQPSDISKIEDTKPNSFSTDSTHDSNPKNQKYFFNSNNNKSYAVYLILYEEKMKIKVNTIPEGKDEFFFEREITQEELMKINRVFQFCNNIEESFDYFNTLFSDKQNQINIKEENDKIVLNKKIKLSQPLNIEIQKKKFKNEMNNFIQNNNLININNNFKNDLIQENKDKNNNEKNSSLNLINFKDVEKNLDIENILPLNIGDENKKSKLYNYLYNSKAENDIIELPEEQEIEKEEIDEEKSKKNLVNNIPKTKSKNSIYEENKRNNSSLLNKKRISDSSDMSFNSVSNENEFQNYNSSTNITNTNKKSKNNLAKENFLKFFSDNASVNSVESEKFFVKVQKNLNLEKNKSKYSADLSMNQDKKNAENKKEENDRSYLFGDEDSSEYIKDDIDLFSNKSNKSPTITPIGVKNNNKINDLNEGNFKLQMFNGFNENQDIIPRNFSDFKNCIQGVQNIQIKDNGKDSNINYNLYNSKELYNKNKKSKFYKPDKSYRIIHKNYIEYCTTEISYLFGEEMNKINNKSFSVDSNIISGYSEFDFIIHHLKKKFNKEIIDAIRIYQATENGATASDFHRECDQNTNVLVLIKTNDGKKFGGYTSVGFSNFNRSYHDGTAFLFSIDKREIYPNIPGKNAVDSYYNLGPCFSGESIKIFDNFLKNGGVTVKNSANFETNEDYQITNGKIAFGVEEIEVLEFLERKNDDDNII
jgi:hypothetical protein